MPSSASTNEYLKRQLAKRGVAFEALDNGVKSCASPKLMQRLCDELSADKIDRFLRKWLRRLPHPFPARDRSAGYRYQLSILQAEFTLTQVLDQPVTGRIFFEEVIRENLDIGRPSQVSLVFDRKVNRRTPGPFRTRVITDGVVPSLHVDYKKTRIKQYHKEGQALRTETTINDTRDFAIGRRIENLEQLRKIGFAANRRLLDVQRIGHDCFIGEASFQDMQRPITVNDQRAAALRFADPRVQALLYLLLLFLLVQGTFTSKDLREHLAPLLGKKPSQLTPGRITYDLRRLRLHGLTERISKTHRYRITPKGLRTAIFYTRLYNRSLRTGLAIISPLVMQSAKEEEAVSVDLGMPGDGDRDRVGAGGIGAADQNGGGRLRSIRLCLRRWNELPARGKLAEHGSGPELAGARGDDDIVARQPALVVFRENEVAVVRVFIERAHKALLRRIVAGSTTWTIPSKLGHSRVIHTSSARSLPRSGRRAGRRLKAILS